MTKTRRPLLVAAVAAWVTFSLVTTGACADEQNVDQFGCSEKVDPPVDVAGHLAIAAHANGQPLRGLWQWGAVPVAVAVGPDGSVYWSQYRTDTIERADRNGNRRETVAAVDGPLGLAIDGAGDRLFYVSDRHYPRSIGSLRLAEKPEALVVGSCVNRPFAIALAQRGAKLYWTESINGRIRSAGIDGSQVETLFDDGIASANERADALAMSSAGIAVDEQRGLLFWSDLRTATIVRAQLDGSGRQVILSHQQGLDSPTGLVLDAAAGKLYWADPGAEAIGRADLNGLHPEVVVGPGDGVLEPYGLAIDAERRLLYWTDVARNALYRTHLDHKRVDRFVSLDVASASLSHAATTASACEAATSNARQEFLRRWVKLVRTCVIEVSATKAVMRSAYDLRTAADTCSRQLRLANDTASLRADLAPHCDAEQLAAAVGDTFAVGAEIVAADLPRSAAFLRAVRPFVAGHGPPDATSTREALAALDALVARLEGAERAAASTIDWTLPATGQTTSYAAATRFGAGATPVADDGATRAGARAAYADNGDGTISDPNTGLMWEKKCDGCGGLHNFGTRYPWRATEGETGVFEWLRAVNREAGAGFAGHDDWRLPRIGELVSIVDYERFNPAVSDAFDGAGCGLDCSSLDAPECSCTELGPYWTAGNSPRSDDVVPVVAFNLGLVLGQPTTNGAFVRAVRGPLSARQARFVDNGDGTITDRTTRLMWEKKCRCPGNLHDADRRMYWSFDGREETLWDWLRAVNNEGGKGFAGYDDWRAPNVKELYSLFDESRRDPSIDPVFAGGECADLDKPSCSSTGDRLHWTSTTFADFPSLALAVGFRTPGTLEREPPPWVIRVVGGVEPHEKTLSMVTRAVRGPVPAAP